MRWSRRWFVIVMAVGLSVGPAFGALVVQEDPLMEWDVGSVTVNLIDQLDKELIFEEDRDGNGMVTVGDVLAFQAALTAGEKMELTEEIEIGLNTPWTGWHEVILTADWKWGQVLNFSSPDGITGLNPNVVGNTAEFAFDALYPGTKINIRKELIYLGNVQDLFPSFGGPPVPNASKILVQEYPTPEPATMSLLALGALAVLRRRRRG